MNENPLHSDAKTSDDYVNRSPSGFMVHLIELRKRLLTSCFAVLFVFVALYYFSDKIYFYLAVPILRYLPEDGRLIATGVAAPFLAPLKLTLVLSFFIAIPVVLHQVWQFISPGLYARERRWAVPLLILSVLLFCVGAAFAYFVVFPLVFHFFSSVVPQGVVVTPDISAYLNFTLKLFVAFGLAFEAPIVTLLCIWSGLATVDSLRKKRPYIIVIAFTIGMLLTPPDVISQIMLAVPLWLLFEVGILIARFFPVNAEKIVSE